MTTEPKMPPLPERLKAITPWIWPSGAALCNEAAERVAELERENDAVLKDRVALAMRVEELEKDAARLDALDAEISRFGEPIRIACLPGTLRALLDDLVKSQAADAARSKEQGK